MAAYNVANYSAHKNEHLEGGGGGVRGFGGNVRAQAKSRSTLLTQRIHTLMKAQINYLTKDKSVNVLVLQLAVYTNSTQHSTQYNNNH